MAAAALPRPRRARDEPGAADARQARLRQRLRPPHGQARSRSCWRSASRARQRPAPRTAAGHVRVRRRPRPARRAVVLNADGAGGASALRNASPRFVDLPHWARAAPAGPETGSTTASPGIRPADAGLAVSPQGEWLQVNAALAAGRPACCCRAARAWRCSRRSPRASTVLATPAMRGPPRWCRVRREPPRMAGWYSRAARQAASCSACTTRRRGAPERERAASCRNTYGLSHELRAAAHHRRLRRAWTSRAGGAAGGPTWSASAPRPRADDLVRALLEFLRAPPADARGAGGRELAVRMGRHRPADRARPRSPDHVAPPVGTRR